MEQNQFFISLGIFSVIFLGIAIFILKWALFSNTESNVRRLDEEIQKAREKQVELSRKIKEADEELEARRKEARELVEKMRNETDSATKEEREKIIKEAREEGENIITKAQEATTKMRLELEREMDIRAVDFSMSILNKILSDKAKSGLDQTLVSEFIEDLRNTDMNNISPEINAADIVSLVELDSNAKSSIQGIIKEKLKREIQLDFKVEADIGGGIVIKFGSLALDGSIKNLIREEGISLKTELDAKTI